jgi:hypothetical protein
MSYDIEFFRVPEGVEAFVQFEPDHPLSCVNLDDEAAMVQLSFGERFVSLNMPYFDHEPARMMLCVRECIRVLNANGFTAYDPQLQRAVSVDDLDAMTAQYSQVDHKVLARMLKTKPWWKFW